MSTDALLSRLHKVKRTGPDRWTACCPAHDDKGPSLAIKRTEDGRTLVHCFAGCSAAEVVAATGLSLSDLMPPRATTGDSTKGERRPFPALDVLRCVAFESLVVLTAGASMVSGEPLSAIDRQRLALAVGRLQAAVNIAEGGAV